MSMNKLYFESNKQRVLYFILKFVLGQCCYFRYIEEFLIKDKKLKNKDHNLFTDLYTEKYRKIE